MNNYTDLYIIVEFINILTNITNDFLMKLPLVNKTGHILLSSYPLAHIYVLVK